ncbi:MAG TPA: response regulator transcription factor [Desulfovibrio sp.]|uniref:response regulator n=1 Tax=Desulfovibrio TaxID=872 RepID=UPI0004268DF2|nr:MULTISPECIES: response regulator transcription factor [Desulfovibrio]HMM37508.1 response regulator transcription factor [Desulfovibrio sp.]
MKILLVDDHGIVRCGIREVAQEYSPDLEFEEASTSQEAMRKIAAEAFGLVLLDLSLPDESGLETMRKIRNVRPELPVLVLSMHLESEYVVAAFRAGANGYLPKSFAAEELVTAISDVLDGKRYISPALTADLLDEKVSQYGKAADRTLSEREKQVLILLAQGEKLCDVAERMGLNPKTVGTYKIRAMKKLGLKNNAQLFQYMAKCGFRL